jgi:hypothetical protein
MKRISEDYSPISFLQFASPVYETSDFFTTLVVSLPVAIAAPHTVCQSVAMEKDPAAFLFDPKGKLIT